MQCTDIRRSEYDPLALYFTTYLQVEFNELEAFNGDSSSVIVEEDLFDIDRLQPGRNYSIAIKAVSKGMESVGTRKFVATRKCSDGRERENLIKLSFFRSFRADSGGGEANTWRSRHLLAD